MHPNGRVLRRANLQNPGVPAKARGRFGHNIPYANAAVA
jgi:hypothetical protein